MSDDFDYAAIYRDVGLDTLEVVPPSWGQVAAWCWRRLRQAVVG